MYVQYGAAAHGMPPNGYAYQAGAYAAPPAMNGGMGGYYPPPMPNQYSSRAHFASPPGTNPMLQQQTPRDPYAMAGPMPGLVSGVAGAPASYAAPPPYAMPPDAGMHAAAAWQPQRAPGPDAYGGAKAPMAVPWGGAPGMPQPQGALPGAPPPGAGAQPGQPYPGQPGPPRPQQVPGGMPPPGTQPATDQAAEPDPDDDPNRLPTFVKVRGLPAEHDPRIARRPKPKKRAPGVCCA